VARLVYSAITSLDGYVVDADGSFEWAAPDEEVHAFVNEQERPVGTYLLGRRMYDVMQVWETMPTDDEPPVMADYAGLWKAADKIVYSRTLESVSTPRTTLERSFDPTAVRSLVAAADRDVSVGGPTLAAAAVRAGIVDDWHQYLHPVVVGGGTHWLPTGVRLDLELVALDRFRSGVVHLQHRTRR
jgi:dihydrofolate reductase